MTRRVARSLLILVVGYAFGGVLGLVVAVAAVAAREVAHVRTRFLWITAILALIGAPAATIAQGLPSTPIAGVRLTAVHVLSHKLATVALILVVFAALIELGDPTSADSSPLIPRRPRTPREPRHAKPAPAGTTVEDASPSS